MSGQGTLTFAGVPEALEEIRAGRPVIVVKNEGRPAADGLPEYVVAAAALATPEVVNRITSLGRGMLFLGLTPDRCDELELREVPHDEDEGRWQRKLLSSFDARGISGNGISAANRARAISVAIDPAARPDQLTHPGYVWPLRTEEGGVLVRAGQTEAAVDLARLAGLFPAAVMSELLDEAGDVADAGAIAAISREHDVRCVTIAELVAYRRTTERLLDRVASARLPTARGDFEAIGFRDAVSGVHHLGLGKGELSGAEDLLVAVQRECLVGAAFRSTRCDCGERLYEAMDRVEQEGRGIVLNLSQDRQSTGAGPLLASCREYEVRPPPPATGIDSPPPPWAEVDIAGQVLTGLGVRGVRLLTTLPMADDRLREHGIRVRERLAYATTGGRARRS